MRAPARRRRVCERQERIIRLPKEARDKCIGNRAARDKCIGDRAAAHFWPHCLAAVSRQALQKLCPQADVTGWK